MLVLPSSSSHFSISWFQSSPLINTEVDPLQVEQPNKVASKQSDKALKEANNKERQANWFAGKEACLRAHRSSANHLGRPRHSTVCPTTYLPLEPWTDIIFLVMDLTYWSKPFKRCILTSHDWLQSFDVCNIIWSYEWRFCNLRL